MADVDTSVERLRRAVANSHLNDLTVGVYISDLESALDALAAAKRGRKDILNEGTED